MVAELAGLGLGVWASRWCAVSVVRELRRAGDGALDLPVRVCALHAALSRFAPFGWRCTLALLHQAAVDVVAPGSGRRVADGEVWTESELVVAVDLLSRAHASWVAFSIEQGRLRRVEKRISSNRPCAPVLRDLFGAWCVEYFVGPGYDGAGEDGAVMGSQGRVWRLGAGTCGVCTAPASQHPVMQPGVHVTDG